MNSTKTPGRKAFAQTSFIFVAAVLLAGAVILNTTTLRNGLHFKKEAVPQPRDFHDLPALMGHWLQVSTDEQLDKEIQDVLGTDKYVYRDYLQVDEYGAEFLTNLLTDQPQGGTKTLDDSGAALLVKFNQASTAERAAMIQDALKSKTPAARKDFAGNMQLTHPDSIVNVGLTYYTGLVDTVAHIPDRCYIADGYEPSTSDYPTWDLGLDPTGKDVKLQVRFISFDDVTGNHRVSRCVAYVFHCNGHYESDPWGVRQSLQSLTQRYGYYSKIELMTVGKNTDTQMATAAMTDFLADAKPQIETCFPDWAKLTNSGK
jgi:hypothetical protein